MDVCVDSYCYLYGSVVGLTNRTAGGISIQDL